MLERIRYVLTPHANRATATARGNHHKIIGLRAQSAMARSLQSKGQHAQLFDSEQRTYEQTD